MTNKSLGLLALAGAPFFLLSTYLQPLFPFLHPQQFYGLWGTLYLSGWMCSIMGLQRLQAAGTNRFGKIILRVQLCALALALLSNLYQVIFPGRESSMFFALDAFWPVSNLLMLVSGITIVAAKNIKGWQRFAPLFAGLWLPVLFISVQLWGRIGISGTVAAVYSGVAWSLMAVAVATAKKETKHAPAHHPSVAFS